MRREELKDIFDLLQRHVLRLYPRHDQRTTRLADKIMQDVRDSGLGELSNTWEENCAENPELTTYNPYKLIRMFENVINPPEPNPLESVSPARAVTESRQPPGPKAFPIEFGEVRQVIGQGIKNVFRRGSIAEDSTTTIEGIFEALEARVRARQRERARTLIERRAATVAVWRRELNDPGSSRRPSPSGQSIPE